MEKKIDTPNNDVEQLLSVHQFARQHKMNSMKKEGGGLSAKIQSAETSLGGLRQELGQVMQINTGSRRSSLGGRYLPVSSEPLPIQLESMAAVGSELHDKIAAAVERALQSAAAEAAQKESTFTVMLQDSSDQLLERLEGLQLRLQYVEEEQEGLLEREQQHSRKLDDLQQRMAASCCEEDSPAAGQISSADSADCSAEQQQQRAPCMPFSLPEPASMVPSDAAEAEACLASPAAARSPSPFASPQQQQQQQQQQRPLLSPMQHRISQVADEVQFAALQAELKSVKRRLQDVEQAAADAAPLDGLQCGAVEARLAILEEDYAARHAGLDDAAGDAQGEQQQRQGQVAGADQLQADLGSLAARVAALEEQQQQMYLAAQSGEASAALLEMQPTVKNRIEQFEEQLNAAISRFAPGHLSSSSRCGTPTAAEFRSSLSGSFTRDASRQELQQQLNTLQQEVVELQSRLDDLTDGSSSSQQQQHVQPQQLQELEQKLQQGNDQLAEQVLQLDLQLQMVEDKLRRQQQQAQAAVWAAEAAEASAPANKQQLEQLQQQEELAGVKETLKGMEDLREQVAQLQLEVESFTSVASNAAQQSRDVAEQLPQLRLDVQQAAAAAQQAAKDAAESHEETAAAVQRLETQLPAASEAARQATAAAAAVAELQQHLAQLSGAVASSSGSAAAAAAEQTVQQQKQLDELSQLLFELRVEMQNGVGDATQRLEDLEILEASRKAAAARAEEAAADALEKAKSLREDLEEALAAIGPISPVPSTLSSPGPAGLTPPLLVHKSLPSLPSALQAARAAALTQQQQQAGVHGDLSGATAHLGWQQQQQQPGVAPLSPGLSFAELSTGAPLDLEGSEADSDLLESNVTDKAWQPAAAAAAAARDPPAAAAAGAQQLVGSLVPCDSSSDASSAISSSYCASEAEEEEVERSAFVEYTNPAAAGAEELSLAGNPRPVQQQQQWRQPGQQQQQQQQGLQELAHELDGGASWLRSSEGGNDDGDNDGGGGYLDDGRTSFGSDDELPVMRMTGGAGYQPYDPYDDYCGSEDGDDYEEELAAAAAHNTHAQHNVHDCYLGRCVCLGAKFLASAQSLHWEGSRRVSGSAGTVKLVPLIDWDQDSSSEPGSSSSSSSSSTASDTDGQIAQPLDSDSSRKVSRQDSSSSQGRVRQRLPTPKASLTGDDEGGQPQQQDAAAEAAAATASESEAAAAATDDSLVAGLRQLEVAAIPGSNRAGSPAKAVRFCEWVQQLEFGGVGCGSEDDDSSSVESFTEEQLLEAQGGGEFTSLQAPPDAASYQTLMHSSSSDSLQQDVNLLQQQQQQQQQQPWNPTPTVDMQSGAESFSGSGVLTPVQLVASKPTHKAAAYRLQLFTADRISAGLPAGQRVVLQLLGPAPPNAMHTGQPSLAAQQAAASSSSSSTGSAPRGAQPSSAGRQAAATIPNSSSSEGALGPVLLHAELPRARGSFDRGSVESFTVLSEAGDLGEVAALLLWHEPEGSSIGGGWCLEKMVVEAALKGVSYSFSNSVNNNGWVVRGRGRAVLLSKPKISKRGDAEAVQVEAAELQGQLDGNAGLSGEDRGVLQRRLAQLQARLAASG
ncbi:hypothetical protein OEZ86_010395 [Tetradesmus obliquus]|nr:hypothetical protein OEZ86_010395 [Tetradesmus obliquus]